MNKNFIDINNFTRKQIDQILILAKKIKKNPKHYSNICKNKTLCMIFEKQSLRTRVSFNIGMQRLGGNVIELNAKDIGFDGKREDFKDILNILSQFTDCLMIRNDNHEELLKLSNHKVIPIINGLTNYSHPCQILGDFMTIQEIFKKNQKLLITWIGDFNNVLRSLLQLQNIYKFKLNVVTPKKILLSKSSEINKYKNNNLNFLSDPMTGSKNSNCIMTDVWVSMGEKKKNVLKSFKNFTVNKNIIQNASKNVIFMHCLPAKRGKEVTSEVLDGNKSVVFEQAKNRMFIQQAILIYVLKN